MKFAVIKTGGKQHVVTVGKIVRIEKLLGDKGSKINFDPLFVSDKDGVILGDPILEKNKVKAVILRQGRAAKKTSIKYKPKVRYRKQIGHRQYFTEIQVTGIG